MTVRQTVAACCLDREIVEQSVCELVSLKMIAVRPPESPCSPEEDSFVRELETFHAKARESDYYDLLGVAPDTPRAEMRNRYFELSKRFHPDKAFGRSAKTHKDKMSFIFNKLTQAYDILSNAKKREEYNESIADRLELRAIEQQLKAAVAEKKSTSAPPRAGASFASTSPANKAASPPTASSSPNRLLSDAPPSENAVSESDAASSKTVARESFSNSRQFSPTIPPDPSSDARREEIRRRRASRAVVDLLRRRTSDSPTPPPPVINTDNQLAEAEAAFKQERFAEAAAAAKMVLNASPGHTRATELLKTATEAQGRIQAQMHLRRGYYAVREGQFKEAKWHLEQAALLDKKNTDARHLLAQIMLQQERDCIGALALMKEVIVLGGQRSRYFATLGDIFLEMKDTDRATDAFNKALRLDADNKELKKKLRLCRK